MFSCEYCGEPSTKSIDDLLLCDQCYAQQFGYAEDDDVCIECGEPFDLTTSGVKYCSDCFHNNSELSEDDID